MSFIDALLNAGMRARLRGAVRLLRLVRGANPVPLTRTRTKHGLTIWIDPTSYMDQRVLDTGYFDEEVLDAVQWHPIVELPNLVLYPAIQPQLMASHAAGFVHEMRYLGQIWT